MVRITNSEQISLALKARLQSLKSKKKAEHSTDIDKTKSVDRPRSDPLHKLALDEGLAEKEIGRALVRALLNQEFGDEIAADPRFEQVIQRVSQILEHGEEGQILLEKALIELRGNG